MASLLDDLKASTPISTGPKVSTGPKRTSALFDGLLNYCMLDYVKKQIEGKLKTHPVKKLMIGWYVETFRLLKVAPTESITAKDGSGSANVSLLKKNSRSKLDSDTIALCQDMEIDLKERMLITVKEDLPEDKINSVLKALEKAGIDWQTVFDVERKVLPSDQTLNDIFKLGENTSNERMAEILGMVASLTVRPKFGGDLAEAFEACRLELNPTAEELAAIQKAAAAQAKAGGGEAPKASANAKDSVMDALKRSLAAEGGADESEDRKGGKEKKKRG